MKILVNPLHGVERRERIEDQYKRLIERIHYMELKVVCPLGTPPPYGYLLNPLHGVER